MLGRNDSRINRIERLKSDPQARTDAERSAAHILDSAKRLAADGTLTPDDLNLIERMAIVETIIPFLSNEQVSAAQKDGSWNKASLSKDEESEAIHVGRRVVVLELQRLVKAGQMDASEARRILSEDAGVESTDENDQTALDNLAALASNPKRHRELSPDLRDAAAEDKAVSSYIKRTYGGASDDTEPAAPDDEDVQMGRLRAYTKKAQSRVRWPIMRAGIYRRAWSARTRRRRRRGGSSMIGIKTSYATSYSAVR